MSIDLAYDLIRCRIAELENEFDIYRGLPPRNKYTCTVCGGRRIIDEAYHGSPDFQECSYCKGGKLIDEANEKLFKGKV